MKALELRHAGDNRRHHPPAAVDRSKARPLSAITFQRSTRSIRAPEPVVPAPRPWANECWNEYIYGSRQTSDQQHAADQTRPYTEGYEYDAAGNITRLRHGSNGGPGWSRHFGMGGLNPAQWAGEWPEHLDDQRLRQSPASNQLTHVGDNNPEQGQTHGFDGNGNLEWELSNRHFVWDYADRLIGFADRVGNECQPTKDACYLYDAGGMRVKKVVRNQQPQVETMVYVDQNFEHRRRPDNNSQNNTLHVLDNQSRVATVRAGDTFADEGAPTLRIKYHFSDHHGSSHVVIGGASSSSDAFISREEYFPYGESSFGSFGRKRFRFTGKERDEESGLYYGLLRYHLPWLCRWINCDPLVP